MTKHVEGRVTALLVRCDTSVNPLAKELKELPALSHTFLLITPVYTQNTYTYIHMDTYIYIYMYSYSYSIYIHRRLQGLAVAPSALIYC